MAKKIMTLKHWKSGEVKTIEFREPRYLPIRTARDWWYGMRPSKSWRM
jgi:hypothetical protein